jgi:hypothetical protein
MVQVWAAATSDLCITLIPIKETVWVKCVQQPLPIYGSPLYLLRKKFGSSVCSSQFLFSREAAGAKPVLWSMMFWDQVSSECTACSVIYDVLWSGKQRVHNLFCDLWCSVIIEQRVHNLFCYLWCSVIIEQRVHSLFCDLWCSVIR